MVFYLSPKDIFLTIGRYNSLDELKLTDFFLEGLSQSFRRVTLPSQPLSVSLEIPSAAMIIEALGYHHIAALGDSIVSPHNWRIMFPLFANSTTKNFTLMLNEVFHNDEPLFIAILMRSLDANTNVHFISPINIIASIQYQLESDNCRVNLTLQSPYTSIGTFPSPQLSFPTSPSVHDPLLSLRITSFYLRAWEPSKHAPLNVSEILSLNFITNKQINWHHTTLSPADSFFATRAATKYTTGHVNLSGSLTLGFPHNYNDFLTRPLKNTYDLTLTVNYENLGMNLNIYGLKPTSWTQTATPSNRPSLIINWVALDHLWS